MNKLVTAVQQFLLDIPLMVTSIMNLATAFGDVLLRPPFSIFLGLAVIGVGFSWFRSFIGSRG